MLFSDPALLRELYCALDGVSLPPDVPVTINTLKNVLFMSQYNDISFEIGGKLVVLVEHQSTINPNMALRLLMYISRIFEKIVKGRNIYSKTPLSIPRPEFFVLYNGKDPFPDNQVLRLSDAFEKPEYPGLPKKDSLTMELVVRVININEGRNQAIADRCKKLAEYSAFVARAREFEKELGSREEALKEAIKYCQKHDILTEFLKENAAEVLSMLYTEFNLDDALAVRYEEGWEGGEENKAVEIAKNALAKGLTIEFVNEITGLDIDTIRDLQASL